MPLKGIECPPVTQPEDEILHDIERNDSGGQTPHTNQRSRSTDAREGMSAIKGPVLSRERTVEILWAETYLYTVSAMRSASHLTWMSS
jgi:hypothetical protein